MKPNAIAEAAENGGLCCAVSSCEYQMSASRVISRLK